MTPHDLLTRARFLPVLVIDDVEDAVPLARALVAGGLTVLEVTLRTPAALGCIAAIARDVPDAVVGAGTVLSPTDLAAASDAGARFAVAPGGTLALYAAARAWGRPFVPGAATASEVMLGREAGFTAFKFFPAETSGGPRAIRTLSEPLPDVRFCPTGGVGFDNLAAYRAVPAVICAGGACVAPREAIRARDWPRITALAARAAA